MEADLSQHHSPHRTSSEFWARREAYRMMSVTKSERGMGTRGYRSIRHASRVLSASERCVQTRPDSMQGATSQPAGERFCREGGAWSKEDLWDSSGQLGRGGVMCSEGIK